MSAILWLHGKKESQVSDVGEMGTAGNRCEPFNNKQLPKVGRKTDRTSHSKMDRKVDMNVDENADMKAARTADRKATGQPTE